MRPDRAWFIDSPPKVAARSNFVVLGVSVSGKIQSDAGGGSLDAIEDLLVEGAQT
jgi:hypothetical protein